MTERWNTDPLPQCRCVGTTKLPVHSCCWCVIEADSGPCPYHKPDAHFWYNISLRNTNRLTEHKAKLIEYAELLIDSFNSCTTYLQYRRHVRWNDISRKCFCGWNITLEIELTKIISTGGL